MTKDERDMLEEAEAEYNESYYSRKVRIIEAKKHMERLRIAGKENSYRTIQAMVLSLEVINAVEEIVFTATKKTIVDKDEKGTPCAKAVSVLAGVYNILKMYVEKTKGEKNERT